MIFTLDGSAEVQTCNSYPRWPFSPFMAFKEQTQMARQRLKPEILAPEGPKHGKVKKHPFWFKITDKTNKEAPY